MRRECCRTFTFTRFLVPVNLHFTQAAPFLSIYLSICCMVLFVSHVSLGTGSSICVGSLTSLMLSTGSFTATVSVTLSEKTDLGVVLNFQHDFVFKIGRYWFCLHYIYLCTKCPVHSSRYALEYDWGDLRPMCKLTPSALGGHTMLYNATYGLFFSDDDFAGQIRLFVWWIKLKFKNILRWKCRRTVPFSIIMERGFFGLTFFCIMSSSGQPNACTLFFSLVVLFANFAVLCWFS